MFQYFIRSLRLFCKVSKKQTEVCFHDYFLSARYFCVLIDHLIHNRYNIVCCECGAEVRGHSGLSS